MGRTQPVAADWRLVPSSPPPSFLLDVEPFFRRGFDQQKMRAFVFVIVVFALIFGPRRFAAGRAVANEHWGNIVLTVVGVGYVHRDRAFRVLNSPPRTVTMPEAPSRAVSRRLRSCLDGRRCRTGPSLLLICNDGYPDTMADIQSRAQAEPGCRC